MDRRDDLELTDAEDGVVPQHETHATTGGAAAAGAVTGAVVGLAGGPAGAAVGAIGGAIVGAAAERIMHHEDDHVRAAEPTAPETTTEDDPRG
jgi:uncharacterized membrane protein